MWGAIDPCLVKISPCPSEAKIRHVRPGPAWSIHMRCGLHWAGPWLAYARRREGWAYLSSSNQSTLAAADVATAQRLNPARSIE